MPAERHYFHLHERKERQARQDVMKLGIAFDIEDADVRVAADDAPDVSPFAGTLQLLEAIFFACLEAVGFFLVEAQRDMNIHLDHGEHDLRSLARDHVQSRCSPIATEASDLVLVERDAQTRAFRNAQGEVGVVERLREDFFGEQ